MSRADDPRGGATGATPAAASEPLAPDEITKLVRGEHGNPHHVLGAHPAGAGRFVVRALRPGAAGVAILAGDTRIPMELVKPAGLWEGLLESPDVPVYRLEVAEDGGTLTIEDPYRFWPTLGEVDLYLIGEGRHERLWERLGARPEVHQDVAGTAFAVWAPNARAVRVVGDFNGWDGRLHPMRVLGASGVWELFLPGVGAGARYKYELLGADGRLRLKADPLARAAERPPLTASVVTVSHYEWGDADWVEQRDGRRWVAEPMSIYEVHLGSWRRGLSYRQLADELADYVVELGFTHVELLPVAEYPFGGSWGYQVSAYYAPTARFGTPDDFRFMIDRLHQRGIGVLVDWVPAHFPKDEFALARFDGTALYEHADPRRGEHPDWGSLVFNFGRTEVRNFLVANALYWLEEFHVDGLRVDAVASILYLDYSRGPGQWVPNALGGREDLDAIEFLRQFNVAVYGQAPSAVTVAEESTSWPGVSRPVHLGGLGFGFKWNMGWMHDTLRYFKVDPLHRHWHHNDLTFSLLYAHSENFILPLSHDEVVHGKGSLIGKMPGDTWQRFANLRAMLAYMWAHPGKQLLFMGGELAQQAEWSNQRSIDFEGLADPRRRGVFDLVRDLNRTYREQSPLWQRDAEPDGFTWIDPDDANGNTLSFVRFDAARAPLVCFCNLSPVPKVAKRVGMPHAGPWHEVLNTDATVYGGSGMGNLGLVESVAAPWQGQPGSAELTLPPLATVWLVPG